LKILLVYPYFLHERLHEEDVSVVPIGLYYVGALLRENHYDVEILNWHSINRTPERIEGVLAEKAPDVIGLSVLHANRWGALEISRIAKKINRRVKIVYGGIGATFLWRHLLQNFNEIDFIVLCEGEYAFLDLIRCIEKEDYAGIEKIRGIAFRKNGTAFRTGDAEVIQDLDRLPIPAKYFEYHHLSSARGCPWNCTFCGSPQFWGRTVRFHSPDYFVDQLELLYRRGVSFFYVSDDTFTLRKERVIEICNQILKRGLRIVWVAISRVDYVDEEILYWMRKAGCIQISYGVESGSRKIRNLLNKGINTEQIRRAFDLTTRYGILARAYFIYGSPGENWATIQESIDLINEIRPLSAIFYILDVFPGTALYSDLKKRGGITDEMWLEKIEDLMYFETDPGLSEELILGFGRRLRDEYYRNLPGFVDAINLLENKEFHEMHSDFLSRLAMTFSHGEYAKVDAINGKERVAEKLYEKSLHYYPNQRAYLGLGIIRQRNGSNAESVRILSEGVEKFPESRSLNVCLGISYMNLRDYQKALPYFLKFRGSREADEYIAGCYKGIERS
jgi:anaerobic magnesium-protoporphyrin IX monomethyl ester cyclase